MKYDRMNSRFRIQRDDHWKTKWEVARFFYAVSTIESPQNRRQNRSNRYFSFINLLGAIQFSIIPKKESTFICSIGTRKFIQATEIRLKD